LFRAAKKQGVAGATVLRGILSYGASSRIHTAKLLDLSFDLPIVVEIVDHGEKIAEFLETANQMIEQAGCGALVTVEKVEVIHTDLKSISMLRTNNPWHSVSIGDNSPHIVQAIIEIPAGSRAKYELDKESGLLRPRSRSLFVCALPH
jgi:PII-like signaling protein